ncbi:uncharacterized protein LAESUDRAFT_669722 [Laetiporus sulphureus 93-53]|uniref:Uncharacterized protein n=1 Tax=Laetiporus sulphureus 93-53 TaxID=1314785 RepID=A0A165IM00_9APHY|nr:uncharacterized protein LAESUDRAFT_669722 [Laetiporus sulphureus 93-53]KZT13264.1 hypothetical protein LAESUDRAFT_669722 [Laetiporus sulphureus 93-53]
MPTSPSVRPAQPSVSKKHSNPHERTSSIPFPSSSKENAVAIPESESSSSDQTSSDKLSELPVQSSPPLARLRSPNRTSHRSLDASGSLSSLDSPSGALHHLSGATRASESESSVGKGTARQRSSHESDRASLPATLQGIRQAIASRHAHRSQSATRSGSNLSGEGSSRVGQTPRHPFPTERLNLLNLSPRLEKDTNTPTSRSPSQSRAASPLRRLGWALHRNHPREEPFVPVDPFRLSFFGVRRENSPSRDQSPGEKDVGCKERFIGCLPLPVSTEPKEGKQHAEGCWFAMVNDTRTFFLDTLPRQVYLILLLGLPAIYWSRVARVFEDAELSKPDVQRMIDNRLTARDCALAGAPAAHGRAMPRGRDVILPFPEDWNPPSVSPALARFKHSWELFVDSLLREWKTLNLVSALLCTCVLFISAPPKKRAILTMFQVNDAEDDPLTRSAALFGLVFALMSLCYGCVYIVQFGTMRSMDRASRWAEEAQKTKTAILWNIWVMLATPAIWLAWSMIAFCVSIMSYVWRTGSVADENSPPPLGRTQAIGVRTAITAVFVLGLLNFAMIVSTFHSYHGMRRERNPPARESERRDAMEEMRERGRERDSKAGSASVVGLGLTGLNETGLGSPGVASLAGIVLEDIDPEKGEYLKSENGRGRTRISPKL